MTSLSVVVPARDEVGVVDWSLPAIWKGLDRAIDAGLVSAAEVVVADDHSSDGTAGHVETIADKIDRDVRAVPVEGPGGLGAALRTGLRAATGDLVLYTDADLPFDPLEIPRLVHVAGTFDAPLVCGYRFDRTGEGYRRAAQSWVYNGLSRLVLSIPSRDVNFACKLIRRDLLDQVLPEMESTGSFVDVEFLARTQLTGAHVVHVGLDYFPRFGTASTLGGIDAIKGIVRDFRRLGPDLRRRSR